MARALGGVGAWAEEAEREEAEQKKQQAEAEALRKKQQAETEAAAAAGKSRRKNNPTLSNSELPTRQYVGPGAGVRYRPLPDARVFPFPDRNRVTNQAFSGRAGAGFDPRSQDFDRKREPVLALASRADQVDDWGSMKRATAVPSSSERRGIPPQDGKRSVESATLPAPQETRVPELVQKPGLDRARSDPFAGARPREQVLAEKEKEGLLSKDKVIENEKMDAGGSGAEKTSNVVEEDVLGEEKSRSSTSSRPPTPRGPELEPQGAVRKKKANPFGEATLPREVLLEQRGVDYRKKDLELERRPVVRPESEKEKELKEEIRELKKLVKNAIEGDCAGSGQVLYKEHTDNLRAQLNQKESKLQELTLRLDDMVRFPQKHVDRPNSRSGRSDHSGKLFSGPERPDISRGYNPERLGSLTQSGDITGEYDGGRSSLSSRNRDVSRRFEPERRGGMVKVYDRRSSAVDRPSSRSGSGDFPGGYDVNKQGCHSDHAGFLAAPDSGWSGPRPGYDDFFQGNGSERGRSYTEPFNINRGHPPERIDSRSERNNTSRGYDSERPNSGSWQSDPRGYGPERPGSGSWHDDTRAHESQRPGTGSRQGDTRWHEPAGPRPNSRRSDTHRGLVFEREPSLPAREKHFRGGSDFDRPGTFAGYNEGKRNVFDRLGPMPAQRETPRRSISERLGGRPSSVDAHQDPDAIDWPVGNDDSRRLQEGQSSYAAYESETMEPWQAQEDNRRSYDSNRGSERSRNDQFIHYGGNYGNDFPRRRNYRQQEYDRRGNYTSQDKFISQGRGVRVNNR